MSAPVVAMRAVMVVGAVAAAAWVSLVVLAWGFQRQLIYLPVRAPPDLGEAELEAEAVVLRTADGLRLGAWFVPAHGDAVSTVLVASGNAGNRAHRAPLAAGLAERGHHVLLMDYRGYGGNPGHPDEDGLLADARAGLAHLEARPDVDPERVAFLGESLGCGVVAALAAERPPVALVLRSPFPALADVGRTHYPFLPVATLLRDRFPVAERLARYAGPVLVVAGDRDQIVPPALSRAVARDAGAEYVEIAGADHNDRALLDGARFLDAVDDFLRTHAAPR